MKKLLFFLLGLTIAVGASADVGNWRDYKPANNQATLQTFQERFKSHDKTHKVQPASRQASVSKQANVVRPEALKGFTKDELAAQK